MTTEVISTKGSFDLHEFYKKSRAEEQLKRKQDIQHYVNKYSAQQLAEMLVTALEDAEAQRQSDEHNREIVWRAFEHFKDEMNCRF